MVNPNRCDTPKNRSIICKFCRVQNMLIHWINGEYSLLCSQLKALLVADNFFLLFISQTRDFLRGIFSFTGNRVRFDFVAILHWQHEKHSELRYSVAEREKKHECRWQMYGCRRLLTEIYKSIELHDDERHNKHVAIFPTHIHHLHNTVVLQPIHEFRFTCSWRWR